MDNRTLRNRLLDLETLSPELEERYRNKMKEVLTRPLTPAVRIRIAIALAVSIAQFLYFGAVAIRATFFAPGFPLFVRLAFGAGALFGLAFAVILAAILKKGSLSLSGWLTKSSQLNRMMHPAVFGITWAWLVLAAVVSVLVGNQLDDGIRGLQVILSVLVFIVLFGTPLWVTRSATESELLVREKFLELELSIAEIKELLSASNSPGDDTPA